MIDAPQSKRQRRGHGVGVIAPGGEQRAHVVGPALAVLHRREGACSDGAGIERCGGRRRVDAGGLSLRRVDVPAGRRCVGVEPGGKGTPDEGIAPATPLVCVFILSISGPSAPSEISLVDIRTTS